MDFGVSGQIDCRVASQKSKPIKVSKDVLAIIGAQARKLVEPKAKSIRCADTRCTGLVYTTKD